MNCGHHNTPLGMHAYSLNHLNHPPMKNNTTTTTPPAVAIYLRVSTARQGASGLGLDAQRARIAAAGIVGREFIEVETGKNDKRPQLAAAIAHVKSTRGQLIVASLDRLSRNVAFLFRLKETCERNGIQITALDVPEFNTLTLGIFATIAQHERERISARTKNAMRAKLERDGQWRTPPVDAISIKKSTRTRRELPFLDEALTRAARHAQLLFQTGMSMRQIAGELNALNFATGTVSGTFDTPKDGQWSSMQVKRLFNRFYPSIVTPTARGRRRRTNAPSGGLVHGYAV